MSVQQKQLIKFQAPQQPLILVNVAFYCLRYWFNDILKLLLMSAMFFLHYIGP